MPLRLLKALFPLPAFCACALLAGCAPTKPLKTDTLNTVNIAVEFAEPNRTRFSGKGAGAGMMLSSSMGAAGVAIGIAIDEGIGKDIHATAKAAGVAVEPLVIAALRERAERLERVTYFTSTDEAQLVILIKRYGFILQSGVDDPAAAQFIVHVSHPDSGPEVILKLDYPADFIRENASVPATAPLQTLKTNAADIEQLWRGALRAVFSDSRFQALLQF